MELALAFLLVFSFGGVCVWYFWVRPLQMDFDLCKTNRKQVEKSLLRAQVKIQELGGELDAVLRKDRKENKKEEGR